MKSEKKHKKKAPVRNRRQRIPVVREIAVDDDQQWTPLFAAFHEAFEFALDIAARLARGFPDDVETVERVRDFMRARIEGRRIAPISVDDVLFTFGLLIAAIGHDLDAIAQACVPMHLSMRFPSATEFQPRIPRRLHHQFS